MRLIDETEHLRHGARTHPVRARPKSHIFRSHDAFSSRLLGLRSRCSTLAVCTYLSPRSTCAWTPDAALP